MTRQTLGELRKIVGIGICRRPDLADLDTPCAGISGSPGFRQSVPIRTPSHVKMLLVTY